ncbi:MAG TPA: hypothetical protein VHH34_16355 [Pseudonocardiaceae bacterium]|nr:hypothetical protein [Pseudonocardiaceae bacterium]
MSSWEIILVLGGAPLAILLLLALLTLGPAMHRTPRYRPGDPWNHPPVWWTANPAALRDSYGGQHHAVNRAGRGGCRGDW